MIWTSAIVLKSYLTVVKKASWVWIPYLARFEMTSPEVFDVVKVGARRGVPCQRVTGRVLWERATSEVARLALIVGRRSGMWEILLHMWRIIMAPSPDKAPPFPHCPM